MPARRTILAAALGSALIAMLVAVVNAVLAVARKPKRTSHIRAAMASGIVAIAAAVVWAAYVRRGRQQPVFASFVNDTFPEIRTNATPMQTALL